MAILYDQIKLLEKRAVEKFKDEFPNIPAYEWDAIDDIQEHVLLHLQNQNSTISFDEPFLKTNPSDQEILEYCKRYVGYEIGQQGLDPEKISVIVDDTTEAFFYTRGPIIYQKPIKEKSIIEIVYETLLSFRFFHALFDNTITQSPPIFKEQSTVIAINMQLATNVLDPFVFKKASKHEVAHITSAHFTSATIIDNLVYSYYSLNTLHEQSFLSCQKQLQQSQELMADLLPAMLSHEYAHDLCNYAKTYENVDRKSDIHLSYKDLVYWLKRIILLHKIGSER